MGLAEPLDEDGARHPSQTTRYETLVLHRDGHTLRVEVTSRRIDGPGRAARIRATIRPLAD
jgi:hypothetical protein